MMESKFSVFFLTMIVEIMCSAYTWVFTSLLIFFIEVSTKSQMWEQPLDTDTDTEQLFVINNNNNNNFLNDFIFLQLGSILSSLESVITKDLQSITVDHEALNVIERFVYL